MTTTLRLLLGIAAVTAVWGERSLAQASLFKGGESSHPGSILLLRMGEGLIWAMVFIVIAWIVYAIFQIRQHNDDPQEEAFEPPLDVLKKRYIRGEISKGEYDRIRRDIESQ